MKKGNFDTRGWLEVANDLLSLHSERGDSIKLILKFNGLERPNVKLNFQSYSLGTIEEEITDWIDEKPYYYTLDIDGKPVAGEYRKGYDDWKSYVDEYLGPHIRDLVVAGGRVFALEVED